MQRNTFSGAVGVANLGRGGSVNADANWWGCASNPAYAIAAFAGCATVSGPVTVNTWMAAPFTK